MCNKNIKPTVRNNRRCGKRNPNGVSPTITALKLERDATKFGEWPHVCALLTKKQFEDKVSSDLIFAVTNTPRIGTNGKYEKCIEN